MEDNHVDKKFATVETVALMLGLTKQALYEAVRRGLIPAVRIGRRIRFDLDRLNDWAASGGRTIDVES